MRPEQFEPITFAEAIAGVRLVRLTHGRCAIIDQEDVPLVGGKRWGFNSRYVTHNIPKRDGGGTMYLHRLLTGAPRGMVVDHANGNTLDNCRSNLRIATKSQNAQNKRASRSNTSGVKGVSWNKECRKWDARLMVNYKNVCLGLFERKEDAGAAYAKAAKEHHGEFARTE